MSYDFKAIAANLARGGVRHAFGITGSGNSLSLITALQQQGVDYYPVQHEAAAALMAGAACHDGNTAAVAVSIKGPGFANLVPGLLSNLYEGRPALSISEAYARDAHPWQMHKRLDHWSLSRDVVKGCTAMDARGDCIEPIIQVAQQEYPGPCHIELGAKPAGIRVNTLSTTPPGASGSVQEVLDRIADSKRPMVILGSWALRRHSDGRVRWNDLTIPMVTTAAGKGCIDENGDYAAGVITGEVSALSPESGVMADADLILGFGLRNQEVVKAAPYACPLIVIDEIAMQAPGGFDPAVQFSKASADDIAAIVDSLSTFNWGQQQISKQRNEQAECILNHQWQLGPALRIIEQQLFQLPATPRLVLDTGFFCTVAETIWRARKRGDFVGSSVGRFMGVALPTAIGLAISDRSRPVICVVGDGGIAAYLAELWLAVAEKLPLLVLQVSDGGYGSVAAFASAGTETRRATEPPGGNWWRLAEAMQCTALPVMNSESLEQTISQWQPDSGPLFLEMAFEAETYRQIAKQIR